MDFSAQFEIGVGELGLLPEQFWQLTPAEFYYMVEGFKRKRKYRKNEILYEAWHIAVLSRQKEIPPLNKLIQDDDKPEEPQTDEDMLAMVKLLNAAYGGEVVEK